MQKLARVVIVGFPNVGKSTLFNRFLKKKKSLVHSLPGMTRDQIEAPCSLLDQRFVLVDTGGFFDSQEEPLSSKIKEKAWEASQEANLILFVLDGKRGLLPGEEELFVSLKKSGKEIFLVVNKIDSDQEEQKISDYYRLGQEEVFSVSAEHKRNIDYLAAHIVDNLPEVKPDKEEEKKPLKIAVIGRINVGKTSIINRLCGSDKLIVSEIPGTTRDSTDTLIVRNKKPYCLVDTAGIRKLSRTKDKREKAGIIMAKKNVTRADVVCLIMDAQLFPTRQDTAIAHLAHDSGKPLLVALNKWDLIQKTSTPKQVREKVYQKLDFISFAPLMFTSALSGRRVVKILDLAGEVYANGCKKISTSRLNKFLVLINEKHPAFSKKKRRFKIKYMTQKRILPPTFVLFTHSKGSLAPSYRKHFINLLRDEFELQGTPIRIVLRSN
jgi:GTP-binding protein